MEESSNMFQMYQNSGYTNKRNRKRTLILDIDDEASEDTHLGSGGTFNIKLYEPLIIDKHSEVYLDNCMTVNSNIGNSPVTSAFVLKINEFHMKSNVASTHSASKGVIFNSLIIPNEHKTVANNHSAIIHKGKKFNYVCDINPQTIHSLSGTLTDLAGGPMFHGPGSTDQFTYTITGIESGKLLGMPVASGSTFASITTGMTNTSGTFLATHESTATSLHFSTATKITTPPTAGGGDVTFTGMRDSDGNVVSDVTLVNGSGDNPNLLLVHNPGRFIAEFSIVSRE